MNFEFTPHVFDGATPDEVQRHKLDDVKVLFEKHWEALDKLLPEGLNKSLVFWHLDGSYLRAQKSILWGSRSR